MWADREPQDNTRAAEAAIWRDLLEELRLARQERADAAQQAAKPGGGGGNGDGKRLTVGAVFRVASAVIAALVIALIIAGFGLEHRVTVLEGGLFTSADASALEGRLRTERMDYVQAQIDQLRREVYAALGKMER